MNCKEEEKASSKNENGMEEADKLSSGSSEVLDAEQKHASEADTLPIDGQVQVPKPAKNGFDTMPRTAKNSQPSFMRRSSSVPCKASAQNNRGSTSSSDSGFSPGSPNASCMVAK